LTIYYHGAVVVVVLWIWLHKNYYHSGVVVVWCCHR